MPEDRSPCRDFERGVCNRGDSCKYYHPEGAAPAEDVKLPICKDFQNKGCDRFRCKFLHITTEEEADYNNTGKLPEHGGHPERSSNPSSSGNDVCRDFLKGRCDRGSRCKYMHVESYGDEASNDMYGKRARVDNIHGAHTNDAVLLEENELLKHKVIDLEKEILNLTQMNDTLHDQNAKYRSQLSNSVVYPQISQSMYPITSASLPTSTATGANAYNYLY